MQYWKVKKKNLKYLGAKDTQVKVWSRIIDSNNYTYIYISRDNYFDFSYMDYCEDSKHFYKISGYEYKGEFLNIKEIRKLKLQKLKNEYK